MTGPQLIEAGRLIEAGWESFRLDWMADAPPAVLKVARECFFAGALHATTLVLLGSRETAESVMDELKRWNVPAHGTSRGPGGAS
jgi:hypothetical protein